jgi:pectate lyase
MRIRTMAATTACAATVLAAALIPAVPAAVAAAPVGVSPGALATALRIARETLAPGDGWGSAGTGTTGGAAAAAANVAVATDRASLIAALGGDNATNGSNATSKIVLVAGKIDANVDDAGNKLTCADYADAAYDLDAFLAAYDPATWGRVAPTGPLEDARVRSTRNQGERVRINVGSNTTIVGVGRTAKIVGANVTLDRVSNVIVRNVAFEDAHDCFPAWAPTDGAAGNWNSLYDTVTLTGATNVWVDHNTFTDGSNQDSAQPVHFGRPYQVHDGLLDIIRGSDYVTVSYNNLFEHDKTMLIGSTNTPGVDVGRLRVTIHHNRFANVGQRAPRVRFGQVDVYNNYFYATDEDAYSYSWGVGVQSAIYAENNFLLRSADLPLDAIVFDWGGTAMTEIGTLARVGTGRIVPVSLLAEYNATHDPDLGADAGWVPVLRTRVDPTAAVPAIVSASAGAGRLG